MKDQAARVLIDEIIDMQLKAERASIVLGEMSEEYFGERNIQSADERTLIVADFYRNRIFCDIAIDYLFEIRNALDALGEMGKQAMVK